MYVKCPLIDKGRISIEGIHDGLRGQAVVRGPASDGNESFADIHQAWLSAVITPLRRMAAIGHKPTFPEDASNQGRFPKTAPPAARVFGWPYAALGVRGGTQSPRFVSGARGTSKPAPLLSEPLLRKVSGIHTGVRIKWFSKSLPAGKRRAKRHPEQR